MNSVKEIFDFAEKFGERIHLSCSIREKKVQLHNFLNTCGSCSKWMTKSCPREIHNNRTGISSGPSSAAQKCANFVMSSPNKKMAEKEDGDIKALELRLKESAWIKRG